MFTWKYHFKQAYLSQYQFVITLLALIFASTEFSSRIWNTNVSRAFRPYPHVAGNVRIRKLFFMRIWLASTRIYRIFWSYPEIFASALQSGNLSIWIQTRIRVDSLSGNFSIN